MNLINITKLLLIMNIFSIFFIENTIIAQSSNNLNFNPSYKIFLEKNSNLKPDQNSILRNNINITFNQKIYINSNLPNLENLDGIYLPKGFGGITGFLFEYNNKYISISA